MNTTRGGYISIASSLQYKFSKVHANMQNQKNKGLATHGWQQLPQYGANTPGRAPPGRTKPALFLWRVFLPSPPR